jgi:transketolase
MCAPLMRLTVGGVHSIKPVPTAVVPVPSWEAFAAQDAEYRGHVIPRTRCGSRARTAALSA